MARKDYVKDRHYRETTFDHQAHVDDQHSHGETGSELIIFTVWNPANVQEDDNEVCIWKATNAALTILSLEVTLDASGNEVAGDLKYADTFIGLANPTVINDFDTTSGVRVDTSISSGAVAAGKCLYLSFDSAPATAITQMNVVIEFVYD